MYFIKTADLDKLFEIITSEPCTVKTFYSMVFGFRTRFIDDGYLKIGVERNALLLFIFIKYQSLLHRYTLL